ncbi:hypothetical protein TNCV_1044641 [Trichonephila clavipes]|nr:hypothetical protein TNCV_1044641 [Trichonephila clavipes]
MTLSGSAMILLQWIPFHVNLKYNYIVDDLAKGGILMTQINEEPLSHLELYSECKASIKHLLETGATVSMISLPVP